jgi:tRNA pseudouridine32 synthase/23S rRNA pseudouridine746 synthase
MIDYTPPLSPYTDIVFEDEALLVIHKPSGLLSVPGRQQHLKDCVESRYQQLFPEARIVHRLDMETSGLMVLALGTEIHKELSRLFRERDVTKKYIAWVHGNVMMQEGTIEKPLIVDWPNRPRQKIDFEAGKPSLTHWRVLSRINGNTELELTPHTGRSHQLRVHMMDMGHPILGDSLYAPKEIQEKAERLQLHAEFLAFKHPLSGVPLEFHLPSPLSPA